MMFIECLRIDGKVNTRAPPNENLYWGGSNLQVKIFLALEWTQGNFHQSCEISSGPLKIPELHRNRITTDEGWYSSNMCYACVKTRKGRKGKRQGEGRDREKERERKRKGKDGFQEKQHEKKQMTRHDKR